MKAQTILDAILAMDAAYKLTFTTHPSQFSTTMIRLQKAQFALERELGKLDIAVEPVATAEKVE